MPTNFQRTAAWLTAAGKTQCKADVSVQAGVHLEEICEMLDEMTIVSKTGISSAALQEVSAVLRAVGQNLKLRNVTLVVHDKVAFLDSLCDQNVTLDGIAYLAGFDKGGADQEVLNSNDSKLNDDGTAVILPGGKVGKNMDNYKPAELAAFVGTSDALDEVQHAPV